MSRLKRGANHLVVNRTLFLSRLVTLSQASHQEYAQTKKLQIRKSSRMKKLLFRAQPGAWIVNPELRPIRFLKWTAVCYCLLRNKFSLGCVKIMPKGTLGWTASFFYNLVSLVRVGFLRETWVCRKHGSWLDWTAPTILTFWLHQLTDLNRDSR